jgi:streptogramin lyase
MLSVRLKRVLYAICFLFLSVLLLGSGAVGASNTVDQTGLTSYGEVYEINRDAAGTLYVSDYDAYEIWKVDPLSGAYTLYQNLGGVGVLDARPDSAGLIWWSDGVDTFGYVNASTTQQVRWEISEGQNLWGLAIDSSERVWLTESFGSGSLLYRFTPSTLELCAYDIPGGSSSYYLIFDAGYLWLANWGNDRILRFDTTKDQDQVTRWDISIEAQDVDPHGIALNQNGHLWWADKSQGTLGRLEPGEDRVTNYALPIGTRPYMLDTQAGVVWYTENLSDTVGMLDPAAATGSSVTVTRDTSTATESCSTLGAGTTTSIITSSGTLPWTASATTLVLDQADWKIFQLPSGSPNPIPYGITTSAGYSWVTVQSTQQLLRFPISQGGGTIYLPIILN